MALEKCKTRDRKLWLLVIIAPPVLFVGFFLALLAFYVSFKVINDFRFPPNANRSANLRSK